MNLMGDTPRRTTRSSTAHREERSARSHRRRREPPQLRLEGEHASAGRGEVIVHRKGATPAGAGRARRHPRLDGLARLRRPRQGAAPSRCNSASHGAGRVMSRTQAMQTFTWRRHQEAARRARRRSSSPPVSTKSPGVYKDIHTVMAAQTDLVDVLARFDPKLVKMAPGGERPED